MQYTMHIAQQYDSDHVVFTRHRARADAALNSPLIAPGLPPLLCMRSCNHQEWQTWMADLLWCLIQECKTECKGLTFQQKSDNFNLALQTVPFSIITNLSLFFTSTHGLCGRVHIHLLLLWFRFRFTPIISPSSLIETDYVNLVLLTRLSASI